MWQLLVAAAIAGSTGFIAKHFLNSHPHCDHSTDDDQNPIQDDTNSKDGIFRFSSSSSTTTCSGKKHKSSKKKSPIKGRRLNFSTEIHNDNQRSTASQRRFAVSLKKRRTAKPTPSKCSSKNESTLFGWGLGVGIMYMMSAGKTEISKLSNAMDETSKAVQELKTELYKRKSAQLAATHQHVSCKHIKQMLSDSGTGYTDPKDIKLSGVSIIDDVECLSSVLTDEPDTRVLEMDQLEADLASELQKLPWSDIETSGSEEVGPNMGKNEVLTGGVLALEEQSDVSYQCQGVKPSELDQKLCRLLIEQQENQIEDLESELHVAQSKLGEKEAELQALKDCVRRLTEFSLSTVEDDADDQPERQIEQRCISEWDSNSNIESGSESRRSFVGAKRPIDSAQ